MPAPIIAAYEPYTQDRAPVELALAASEMTGAPLIAATVYPWAPIDDDPDVGYSATQRVVTEAVSKLQQEGIQTRLVQEMSVPAGLQGLARALEAGLIVAGSTHRGRTERVLLGSSAERLLQGAPCAVALAPRDYKRRELRKIAVGFVDSPEGHAALITAHELAALAGARLRVISVLHPSGGLDAAHAAGIRPQPGLMLEGRHRSEAKAALEQAVAALPAGVDVEYELHVDDPAQLLLRVSPNVELLISGSRGYGPLRCVLLGGVSHRLVSGSSCPVLVLPRGVERPLSALLTSAAELAAR